MIMSTQPDTRYLCPTILAADADKFTQQFTLDKGSSINVTVDIDSNLM